MKLIVLALIFQFVIICNMFTVQLQKFINNRNNNCSIKSLITEQAYLLSYTPKPT